MISPKAFILSLQNQAVHFFAGVPDSLLSPFIAALSASVPSERHLICANEGSAVALAAGYQMATGNLPLVYMQNSGLGNAVNPLVSLCHPAVYAIPMLILIGWRGEPGFIDEQQHMPMGSATLNILESLRIPHMVIDGTTEDADWVLSYAVSRAQGQSQPFAIVCKKDAFASFDAIEEERSEKYLLTRHEAVTIILKELDERCKLVCTTGYIGREVLAVRAENKQDGHADFLNTGAMGHASQIALGLALADTKDKIICLEGDGSAIMHMGGIATIGSAQPANLKHVIFNNGVHDSVGGQPTAGFKIDFVKIAKACGYASAWRCSSKDELAFYLSDFLQSPSLAFMEIRLQPGSGHDLPRPAGDFEESKQLFTDRLQSRK